MKNTAPSQTESALQQRLRIPESAERVIVFGESSHWDPDWLFTSKEYYRLRIRSVLTRAVKALMKDPRRVYSVECVFFLRMFWEREPHLREKTRELVNEGRMRLTGSGITTPDVTIPSTEAIIRDYLLGQTWLRENGMIQEPRVAYLPDDFGHSPELPAILNSLGVEYTAFARLDGAFFPGCDYRSKKHFPVAGSSAAKLLKEEKSADFIWRATDGSRVLARFLPFTYFQGDVIDLIGPIKWMGLKAGIPDRKPARVASRVDRMIADLAPFARTPYLFCPIGGDFVDPIFDLNALIDAYNRERFEQSKTFAVNAALDDYFDLVSFHRAKLPVLDLDPNPQWMGYYSARPEMKQRCARLAEDLVLAEKQLAVKGPVDGDTRRKLRKAWETAAAANHHDFITGTAPERVWKKEQRPWLIEAQAIADEVFTSSGLKSQSPAGAPPKWSEDRGRLTVDNGQFIIEVDADRGGCITKWLDAKTGEDMLGGLGLDLVLYHDEGGLWRMGHEYRGGVFEEIDRASRRRAGLSVSEGAGLSVTIKSLFEGQRIFRELRFEKDSGRVTIGVRGRLRKRQALTLAFSTGLRGGSIEMDVPGGVVSRPLKRNFDPTYWCALGFAHLRDRESGKGLFGLFPWPAAVSSSGSTLEWIVARNAPKERAFGFLPVLGHPARGAVPGEQVWRGSVGFTRAGDWLSNRLPFQAGDPCREVRLEKQPEIEGDDVTLAALKPAEDGNGIIARLFAYRFPAGPVRFSLPGRRLTGATLCDSRERNLGELAIKGGRVAVPIQRTITSIRVLTE